MSIFSERLKELRLEKGYTQGMLANMLGLGENNKQIIFNYEKGNAEPSISVLIEMANILNCSVDYLIGRSDYRTPQHEIEAKEGIMPRETVSRILELSPEIRSFLTNQYMLCDDFYKLLTEVYGAINASPENLWRFASLMGLVYGGPEQLNISGSTNREDPECVNYIQSISIRKKYLQFIIHKVSEGLFSELIPSES